MSYINTARRIIEAYSLRELSSPRAYRREITTNYDTEYFNDWDNYEISELKAVRSVSNPLYSLWRGILSRCNNPNGASSVYYHDNGIQVFTEWEESFSTFADYIIDNLGRKPSQEYSLDRIDNAGNYCPGNVRWASPNEQARNRNNVVFSMDSALTLSYIRKYCDVKFKDLAGIAVSEGLASRVNFTLMALTHSCWKYHQFV